MHTPFSYKPIPNTFPRYARSTFPPTFPYSFFFPHTSHSSFQILLQHWQQKYINVGAHLVVLGHPTLLFFSPSTHIPFPTTTNNNSLQVCKQKVLLVLLSPLLTSPPPSPTPPISYHFPPSSPLFHQFEEALAFLLTFFFSSPNICGQIDWPTLVTRHQPILLPPSPLINTYLPPTHTAYYYSFHTNTSFFFCPFFFASITWLFLQDPTQKHFSSHNIWMMNHNNLQYIP